ncbi:MAG: hypothetical protein HYZ26_05945 [Chloroflexi bacterium]|nr:hypothetical protein [Chloroflexota bacterium]
MNDELLRLEALKLSAMTADANTDKSALVVRAKAIFEYIKTGRYQEASSVSSATLSTEQPS